MERARVGPSRSPLYRVYRGTRWLTCAIPPVAVIILEETPGLSGLDGINAAGLVVLTPFVVILGFGLTAAVVALARWTYSKTQMRSRVGFALLMLLIVGALSP